MIRFQLTMQKSGFELQDFAGFSASDLHARFFARNVFSDCFHELTTCRKSMASLHWKIKEVTHTTKSGNFCYFLRPFDYLLVSRMQPAYSPPQSQSFLKSMSSIYRNKKDNAAAAQCFTKQQIPTSSYAFYINNALSAIQSTNYSYQICLEIHVLARSKIRATVSTSAVFGAIFEVSGSTGGVVIFLIA